MTTEQNTTFTATYDPADDKIRISASSRLDADTYATVKAAGYQWAPKQGVFYAVWTPTREDLALELAGEIGDEDTSLVDRAEARADRFEGYSDNRAADAQQAKASVDRIADGIPFGQPILIGHHSERHARKDAQKIEAGMRRAVKMWDTAQYWQSRAAGALRHAKYLESPAVRYRRIKTIEADIRRMIADYTPHANVPATMQEPWSWRAPEGLTFEELQEARKAARVPHVWVGPAGRGGHWQRADVLESIKAGHARSIAHCENRIVYEKAMLGEQGGIAAEGFDIQVGGRVQAHGGWYVVAKLNKKAGALLSVSVVNTSWPRIVSAEDIKGYEAPAEGVAEAVAETKKQSPLVNFRAPGCVEMTTAEWKRKASWGDSYYVAEFQENGEYAGYGKRGDYRQRSASAWNAARTAHIRVPVFLTDAKESLPAHMAPAKKTRKAKAEAPAPDMSLLAPEKAPARLAPVVKEPTPEAQQFDAMKNALRSGVAVQVVSADQLFPTPPEVAARMVELANIQSGQCVLEPSAGTGNIVRAVLDKVDTEVLAYEVNQSLCSHLGRTFPSHKLAVRCADFLGVADFQGCYERVLMNPPFSHGADIKHIQHARRFLRPDGVLVAICANGPRQREALMNEAEHWEELPEGTFAGTGVRAALLVMRGEVA
jgi:phospholipid N-methyltransferase